MKMIGQDDIFSCHPMLGRQPSLDQKLHDKAIGEYRFSIFRADREQQDVGSIILINERMMGRMSTIK